MIEYFSFTLTFSLSLLVDGPLDLLMWLKDLCAEDLAIIPFFIVNFGSLPVIPKKPSKRRLNSIRPIGFQRPTKPKPKVKQKRLRTKRRIRKIQKIELESSKKTMVPLVSDRPEESFLFSLD